MENTNYNYKRGLCFTVLVYLMWGFQPLYWAFCGEVETFFLMAARLFFAFIFYLGVTFIFGYKDEFKAALKDWNIMKREIPAALFLICDWAIYLWACQHGRLLECTLGYLIEPVVIFLSGVIFYKERFTKFHFIVLALIVIGISFSATSFGEAPWIVVTLSCVFAFYSAIKKGLTVSPIVSMTIETMILSPFALLFVFLFRSGDNGLSMVDMRILLMLIGAGIVTGVPQLLYCLSVANLPLTALAICGYISPILSTGCAIFLGESVTPQKILTYSIILCAAILYTIETIRTETKAKKEAAVQAE